MSSFDITACRDQFPALARDAVFFDGPAGSQTPQCVIDAIGHYLATMNANHGGVFATSVESDSLLDEAHAALADFVGAADPDEIAFGANMTTMTFALSRALARTWKPGDEVVVTGLDHDANVTPWVLAARDAGATVQQVKINPQDCTLDLKDLRSKLSAKTRLVAVGAASNAVGTINPIGDIAKWVHAAGGLLFVDAVHYAPHRAIDVAAWNCDFLAASAYKFFGPHVGVLWGRRRLLEELPAYKVRPAPNDLPGKWMTGTQNHEGIAGALAAVNYLADLGRQASPDAVSRRPALLAAFDAIAQHEQGLTRELQRGLAELPAVKVWGIADPKRLHQRAPTFSITHQRLKAQDVAEYLADRNIYVWHGNFYALPLTESLGREPDGLVRIGLLHYNTSAEVQRLLVALRELG